MEQPRPLGRGLEQVSRVFLSETRPRPAAAAVAPVAPVVDGDEGALLLHPATKLTRAGVEDAVRDHAEAIEEGLRILDRGIPCAPCGEIDFLGVDRMSQLVVIDVEIAPADELLIRGLGHFDWVVGNAPNLRRMYRGQTVNFSLQPRLILLAPQFSSRVRCAARQIASPEIEWVRYHLVQAGGRAGILFERLPPLD